MPQHRVNQHIDGFDIAKKYTRECCMVAVSIVASLTPPSSVKSWAAASFMFART
eukprot:m.147025 g.147025  ORF g.147025 m.147025 type:complete len:54 (-) comp30512_c0_seq6:44-205(-)